ncbi:hypothetical protein RIR_jg41542.t1 [Rhizophagus irregularis DAOM 181602=DAOM 197198]|nr:hypothetical protein RIR_jg41542.t1 [Rhizophagus irregularis DAOM 181602=DAOM 197198]
MRAEPTTYCIFLFQHLPYCWTTHTVEHPTHHIQKKKILFFLEEDEENRRGKKTENTIKRWAGGMRDTRAAESTHTKCAQSQERETPFSITITKTLSDQGGTPMNYPSGSIGLKIISKAKFLNFLKRYGLKMDEYESLAAFIGVMLP